MARLKNGFLGNASGKLGNVVFAKWRDLFTARSYQPDINDPKSPAQKTQRVRMLSLLNFLKPINQSFIRSFNADICPESTPWAKAIQDNMPAVDPGGCISMSEIRLGMPRYPAPGISIPVYNPFIDQVSFQYFPGSNPNASKPFPFPVTSVLGKYNTSAEVHEFDTRHLLCTQPDGTFYSLIAQSSQEWPFLSWWAEALFWLSHHDPSLDITSVSPNNALSEPTLLKLNSIVEDFNTNITENLLPPNILSFSYENNGSDWMLNIELNVEECDYEIVSKCILRGWFLMIKSDSVKYYEPFEWNLNEPTYSYNIGRDPVTAGIVFLYTLFTQEGMQCSRFNRLYIEDGSDLKKYPFFHQLFLSGITHPASFILPESLCGFCGAIDELFSYFKELWEQGVIHDTTDPDAPDPAGQIFDYTKFACEVYTPEGQLLYKAMTNSLNQFYGDRLVPQQDYNVVFSYDDILIEFLLFNCPDPGKVVYLSPAHIISNKVASDPPQSFMIEIKSKTKRREQFNVPRMPWASFALDNYISGNPPDKATCLCPKNPKRYKAGADLAGKVK